MQQPRTQAASIANQAYNTKKRMLPYIQDEQNQQPSIIKRFSKSFENSMAFTEINNFGFISNKFDELERDSYVFRTDSEEEKRNYSSQEFERESQSNIQRMKGLLPIHLSNKLSEQYLNFLRMVAEIDSILLKKQSFNCKQAFQNIKGQINQQNGFRLDINALRRINFLDGNYYSFHVDPLKNLVVSLPSQAVSLQIRKYGLRKKLYEYAITQVETSQDLINYRNQIPEKELEISKIQLFYPIITKSNKASQENQKKIKFIEAIRKQIQTKQTIIQDTILPANDQVSSCEEQRQFVELVSQIYRNYKVKSMFRVNLIDKILKKGIQLESICLNLKKIIETGTFLKKIALPNKPMIYQIDQTQKQNIIQKIMDRQTRST